MSYCIKCGAKAADGIRYCPECGAEMPQENKQVYTYGQNTNERRDRTGYFFDGDDVQQNKLMGVLSYFGILVLIPVFAGNKNSEYVRFHSNQGLVLFFVSVIVNLLSGNWVFGLRSLINLSGWWFGWVFDIVGLVLFVFAIIGIVNACKGERKELPLIGQIRILK